MGCSRGSSETGRFGVSVIAPTRRLSRISRSVLFVLSVWVTLDMSIWVFRRVADIQGVVLM